MAQIGAVTVKVNVEMDLSPLGVWDRFAAEAVRREMPLSAALAEAMELWTDNPDWPGE